MNFELLEQIRLYIRQKVRLDRIAAENSHRNGYREISLQHENEAAFGDRILKALSKEVCEVKNAR